MKIFYNFFSGESSLTVLRVYYRKFRPSRAKRPCSSCGRPFGPGNAKNVIITVRKILGIVCIVQICFGLNFCLLGLMFYMYLRRRCAHLCKQILYFLQMSAIYARQMSALDMNSVCRGMGCFMHVYTVHMFNVLSISPREIKFLIRIVVHVNCYWHFANTTLFCLCAHACIIEHEFGMCGRGMLHACTCRAYI